jgi:hypothetical protein
LTTISSLWLMILVELLVVTTLASAVLIVLKILRERRDRAVAVLLVQRIKEDGPRRSVETKKLMQQKFGFDEDAAAEIAQKTGREEKKFYQGVINFYLRRDAVGFENLNIDFEAAVDPYRTLQPPGSGGDASTGEVVAVNESDEIRRLKIENKRLTDEVGVTMQTMSRMLDEYSSMFAGGSADEMDKDAIIQQLKSSVESQQEGGESGSEPEAAEAAEPAVAPDPEPESEGDDGLVDEPGIGDDGDLFADAETEVGDELFAGPESGVEEDLLAEFEADVTGVMETESETEAEQPFAEDPMEEEMDDLSDLEPPEDDLLAGDEKEKPDELIG